MKSGMPMHATFLLPSFKLFCVCAVIRGEGQLFALPGGQVGCLDELLGSDRIFHRAGNRCAVSNGGKEIVYDSGLDFRVLIRVKMLDLFLIGNEGIGDISHLVF